jgi:shikimate 5-dehydrogenase
MEEAAYAAAALNFRYIMAVSDVIINDPNSLFLKEAKKRKAKTINGLGILVNQGALNFKLWTGKDVPIRLSEYYIYKIDNIGL